MNTVRVAESEPPVNADAQAWVDELTLPDDVFFVADGEEWLVYAPFTLGVARINGAALRRLRSIKEGRATVSILPAPIIDELRQAGVLMPKATASARAPFPVKSEYAPEGLTLFMTTRCTLACSYCYASAGDRPSMMTWDTAKAGIDWLLKDAVAKGKDRVSVMFHGGGEVTVAWALMKQCVEYAKAEAAARQLSLQTAAGLNGVMTGPVLDWIIANIDSATVSMDGLPEVHNAQRPLISGRDSFHIVANALRRMDQAGFHYGLRATVTRSSLPKMVDSVEFMCREFSSPVIHLEPVFASGRARTNDLMSPDPNQFVRQFRAAREVARSFGRELKYSGARFGTITNKFCQVSDDLLALTPEGALSSCFEVGAVDDPRAELFFYGKLNQKTGDLDVDMKKVIRLRSLTVEHKSACDDCFCRWSCGGECSAKLALDGNAWDASTSSRCIINRELTLDQMREYLDAGGWPGAVDAV